MSDPTQSARILVIDDEPMNVRVVERMLYSAGYPNVRTLTDSRDVESLCASWWPDLLILDITMPHMDGFAVLHALGSRIPHGSYLPTLMITADPSPEIRLKALDSGANDFLNKPFDQTEVLLRVRNLLFTWFLHRQVQDQAATLERLMQESARAFEHAYAEIIDRLGSAAEFRDDLTGQHTRRVGALTHRIALALDMAPEEADLIGRAAPLHDLGKLALPDSILLKPGKSTPEEFRLIKTHTLRGAAMLAGGQHELMRKAEEIALTHHEWWNGAGYPSGLSGEEIPISGRIVAVADVFDALTSERPYRPALSVFQAIAEMTSLKGIQFDPRVLDAFFGLASGDDLPPSTLPGQPRELPAS